MSGKRNGGIVCFVLAVAFFVSGVNNTSRDPGLADPSGLGVSRAVGSFLPSLVALAVGLWLFQRPRPS